MATATTNIQNAATEQGLFSRMFAGFMRGFEAHTQAASRRGEIEALEAKTDEELAKMGLRREDIPHHVFRDLYYI